ncbi:hypothetical protein ACJJTC_015418 [Scirpophaga incertulas]
MGKGPKKRKKGVGDPAPDDFSSDTDSFKSGIGMDDEEDDKYSVYKASNYIRKYPDGSRNTEYIVFLANRENKPFCDKDRILISKALRKHCVSGVKHLKTINKYRVGIIFDISNNANMFVQNKKFLDELLLTASIPASAAECTGVLKNVPLSLSNKKIFSVIASTRNVIQVRRIMRRSKEHGLQPTSVVAGPYVKNLQYADDLAIYYASSNSDDLNHRLNSALINLKGYFDYLNLEINTSKTKIGNFW